jgi:hypothetical protein
VTTKRAKNTRGRSAPIAPGALLQEDRLHTTRLGMAARTDGCVELPIDRSVRAHRAESQSETRRPSANGRHAQ